MKPGACIIECSVFGRDLLDLKSFSLNSEH